LTSSPRGTAQAAAAIVDDMGDPRKWLVEHGADDIEHAGGSLYAHLNRVYDRLGAVTTSEASSVTGPGWPPQRSSRTPAEC